MNKHLHISLICILCMLPMLTYSQEKDSKISYSFGGGASIDGNNLLWGLNLGTELNYQFSRRFSLNTGISFYQSIGNLNDREVFNFTKRLDQSSGVFVTPTLRYDIISRDSGFKLAFGAGPSLQLGGETFTYLDNFNTESFRPFIHSNRYRRVGLMLELEAQWKTKNPNVNNAFGISAYGADYYFPWYLNATYKVRFKGGKK